MSEIQLAFARLYGLFDETNPDELRGGFSVHCLNEFSQSFPIPNLSYLPPSAVYEAGQLWAFSHEAALALRKGSMILIGLLQAQVLLIYPLIIPRDVSTLYRVFKRVGPPFELPFAETVTGDKVYMQAMLLEGDELRQQVELASRDGFETRGGHNVIRFDAPAVDANRLSHLSEMYQVTDGDEPAANPASRVSPGSSERPLIGLAGLAKSAVAKANTFSPSRLNGATAKGKPNSPSR
ncbi:MAG: hypothetical protein JO071_17295 [Deltaproteobacteria bacterium]|nr:hypothetical protein [Deltaproteobacteria bacterium]